ncbi:MAG: hypothetical protein LBU33_01795 [Endomicrobium sp.]|jgi:hypothetical protein|nr:hypothetical protein [Endomicrobium sp.]
MVPIALARGDNHAVIVKKEGYVTESIDIGSIARAGWVIFDVLFNCVAFLTDMTTGA